MLKKLKMDKNHKHILFILGWSVEKHTSKSLNVEALYLDLEDFKRSKSDGISFLRETESHTPFIKSLLGASVPPEPNLIFGRQCKAEIRGVIKNLIWAEYKVQNQYTRS